MYYLFQDEVYEHFVQNGRFTRGHVVDVPKRYHDLIVMVFWSVTLCVPLFYYIANIFISGSLTLQLSVIVVMFLCKYIVLSCMLYQDR